MTKQRKTQFQQDGYFLDFHRNSGEGNYATDIDVIEYEIFHGRKRPLAAFEVKHGRIEEIDNLTSLDLASFFLVNGKPLPLFLIISFVERAIFHIPTVLLVPYNNQAKDFLGSDQKQWLSPMEFSKFLHRLHKKDWNGNERDQETGALLRNLSEEKHHYPLTPQIKMKLIEIEQRRL